MAAYGIVKTKRIPELTDLAIASQPKTELVINDPEIISRFRAK